MGKATGFLEYERESAQAQSPQERIGHFHEFHTLRTGRRHKDEDYKRKPYSPMGSLSTWGTAGDEQHSSRNTRSSGDGYSCRRDFGYGRCRSQRRCCR